jgi:hypothetical protein
MQVGKKVIAIDTYGKKWRVKEQITAITRKNENNLFAFYFFLR